MAHHHSCHWSTEKQLQINNVCTSFNSVKLALEGSSQLVTGEAPSLPRGVATWLGLSNVIWAGMPQITTKSGFSGSGTLSPLSFPSADMNSEVLVDDRASWWKGSGSLNQHMEENHPMATNHALDCYMCKKQISIVLSNWNYGISFFQQLVLH